MYAIALHIRPTSHLTFRILPGSILDIATYPFVPPTTLSGWLRRLWVLKERGEVPELFWALKKRGEVPELKEGNTSKYGVKEHAEGVDRPDRVPGLKEGNTPKYYVLPRRYIPLGAYPIGPHQVHRTYRHGPRAFNHQEFSKIRKGKPPKGGDLQLHTWEYLLAERFLGVVLAEKEEDLEGIKSLEGYGFKLGKEGFALLEKVLGPFPVERKRLRGPVLGLLQPSEWEGGVKGAFPVYRFVWEDAPDPEPDSLDPSPIKGYEGAYFVWPDGEGEVEGFELSRFIWPWSLVEWFHARREGIARVFFREKEVGFQLLSRHHALVRRFLEEWKEGEGPLEAHPKTRDRLSEAGEKHDWGKLRRFSVRRDKSGRLVYSFKGHRFDIPQEVQDPYVRALIRGHHDYSTLEVVGAAGRFQDPLERERFSEDLYLLMMADQLEAELMVRVYEGKEGEVRPFVEFDLEDRGQEEGVRVFRLDPWPFRKECLEFELEAYFHPYQAEGAETVKGWGEELARAQELQRFRLERHRVRLTPRKEGGKALPQDPEGFYDLFSNDLFSMKPTPFQGKVWKAVSSGHPAHLVLAPTGTGKTEAAAFPALSLGMRLVFALPARSLVDDLEDRFAKYLKVLAQRSERPYRLLVDTGHRQVRRVFHPDGNGETPKERHLYKADVVLTTLDKLLYRYFGYASGSKGYVFPRRIHDGRTLFVFDEAHAYEATAWANFKRLVAALHRAGVAYLVMTATMPKRYQEALTGSLEGVLLHHSEVDRPSRVLHYCPKGKVEELAREHFEKRKRVLVVVEEVKQAAKIYLALKEHFPGEVFLYHGRQAETVRRRVFKEVKKRDGAEKPEPYLLVTTPAIEVGVDLDAEVLITEICPPERLLQRLGRLNRRGKGRGEAYVVGTAYPEYLGQLPEGFTELLRALDGQNLKCGGEERILEAVDYPDWSDPRAQTLFEALHEYVYGLDLLNEGVWRKGFIATRGWEPSVTLRWKDHEVSVNVGLLTTGKEEKLVEAKVCQRVFPDREEGSADWEVPLCSGELYLKDVVVDYPFPYDPELGFVEVPKVFLRYSRQGEERVRLRYEHPKGFGKQSKAEGEQSSEVWVWYLAESARPLEEETVPQSEEEEEEEEGEA